jgi:hypothetical protein
MSQEHVEIVRRYLEEPPPEDVPLEQVLPWIAGFWESNGDSASRWTGMDI